MPTLTPDQERIIEALFETLLQRKALIKTPQIDSTSSYSASLFKKGIAALNQKVDEETGETIEAALDLFKLKQKQHSTQDTTANTQKELESARTHLIHEFADVFYHLLALAAYSDIHLHDIKQELYKRSLPKP